VSGPTATEAAAQESVGSLVGDLTALWLRLFTYPTRLAAAIEMSRWRRNYLTTLAIVGTALFMALRATDDVLEELHLYAGERFTTADLGELFHVSGSDHLTEVVVVWNLAAAEVGADVGLILRTYGLLDLLFVLAYTLFASALLIALARSFAVMASAPGPIAEQRLRRRREPVTAAALESETELVVSLLGGYTTLTHGTLALLYLLALVDVFENVLIILLPSVGVDGLIAAAFSLLGTGKFVAALLVFAGSILATGAFLVMRPQRLGYLGNALIAVRAQLLLIIVLYVGLFASDQSIDALRRWREDQWDFAFAVGALVWLSLLVTVTSREMLRFSSRSRPAAEQPIRWFAIGCIALAAAVFAGIRFDAPFGLVALGIVFLTVAFLSWPLGQVSYEFERKRGSAAARRWLPITLGLSVLALPAFAIIRAYVGPAVLGQGGAAWGLVYLVVIGVAVITVDRLDHRVYYAWIKRRRLVLGTNLVLLSYLIWRIWENPWRISEAFGAISLLTLFLVAVSFPLYYLTRRTERVRPPAVFVLLRLRRTPVLMLVVAWVVIGGRLDSQSSYYDVRVVGRISGSDEARLQKPGLSVTTAYERWRAKDPATNRPMLFVAAAGGGIRAAYWTARVMSCVLEGLGPEEACYRGGPDSATNDLRRAALAASGISGGSLGLAAYVAHVRSGENDADWPRKRLDDDYMSPTIAWALFADFPSALFRRGGGSDRNEVLERAFERSWLTPSDHDIAGVLWEHATPTDESALAEGLFASQVTVTGGTPPAPFLLLNGTKAQDGCRLVGSVLDAAVDYPGDQRTNARRLSESCLGLDVFRDRDATNGKRPLSAAWAFATADDLNDYVCEGEDIRLSTAVMLSARFPYVAPSGRLTPCSPQGATHAANVVDGGYFDTSAASPLVELWARLEPLVRADVGGPTCIVPYLLQIDTGYADPRAPAQKRPSELQVVPQTLRRARDAREHNARQAAALQFTTPFTEGGRADRYFRVYPHVHPGVRAPLGWTLSRAAQAELDEQLIRNRNELRRLRLALAQPQTCA
jgi:hypothetical protein